MMVRKVWADFGPEYNPRHPANPNENRFTLAVDADDYDALEGQLASISRDYEELRKEIDGGSESMTHVDAVDAVREYKEQIHMLESHAKS
jgi:hypothetical protein